MTNIKISLFAYLGVVLFVSATILGGLQFSSYSHLSQLISESYAIGTPYSVQLRYLGFVPSGICIVIFSFMSIKNFPKSVLAKIGFLGIGLFYGIGTILVSIFPCDEGCNKQLLNPSLSQIIHNLSGTLTYMLVPLCLVFIGIAAKKWTSGQYVFIFGIICGLTAMLFVGMLSSDLQSKMAGLYQRIIEGSILTFILICSVYSETLQKSKE
jgi:hypothetical protein